MEIRCRHMGYSFRLAAKVLLHTPSHRHDSTYHGLCYTSRGALAGTRNSSMGLSWRIDLTIHHTRNERSYHGVTHQNGRKFVQIKEGNMLFNDVLNTFYLQLYGVRHMEKDHSAASVLLNALFHGQNCTYQGLCYTSRGTLTGTRNVFG